MLSSAAFALVVLAARTSAQGPLIDQRWPWPYSGPLRIDTSSGPRGIMTGVNQCNATTEGPTSLCVNTVVNGPDDFCIYGLPELDVVGNGEGEAVAYCNRPGYGTRLLAPGAITGLQVVKTPGYLAIAGYIDQTTIDVRAGDAGGELDPHGADRRGNPIGALMYSKAFSSTGAIQQVIQWHLFLGNGIFCLKACDPAVPPVNGQNLCENRFDTVGCNANVPLDYASINGTFRYCQGVNQQVPNGSALPIPATSACTTFASTQLFGALPTPSASVSSASAGSASATASASPSGAVNAVSTSSARSAAIARGVQVDTAVVGAALVSFAALVGAAAVLL